MQSNHYELVLYNSHTSCACSSATAHWYDSRFANAAARTAGRASASHRRARDRPRRRNEASQRASADPRSHPRAIAGTGALGASRLSGIERSYLNKLAHRRGGLRSSAQTVFHVYLQRAALSRRQNSRFDPHRPGEPCSSNPCSRGKSSKTCRCRWWPCWVPSRRSVRR